jgi:hypothetical protein
MQLLVNFIIIFTVFSRFLSAPSLAEATFDQSAEERLLQRIQQRKPLTDADMQAKARILARLLGKRSAVLYDGLGMTIEYVKRPDFFLVEIKTIDLQIGKLEAVEWLESFGFSEDAICNYPVLFYPSFAISQELANSNIVINPLAPDCE